MTKKKALLVVAGGRAVPDVLVLLWLQPQLVRIIVSEQGWHSQNAFVTIAKALPDCQIDILPKVDAYDLAAGMQTCRDACEPYPADEWEWTFTITSSPKVTGIAAYEVAKERGVPCLHVDSQRERIVSLVRTIQVDAQKFFHLSFDDYMRAQHRLWEVPKGPEENYREIVKRWAEITRTALSAPETSGFFTRMHDKKSTSNPVVIPADIVASPFLQSLEDAGAVKLKRQPDGSATCRFTTPSAAKFFGTGDWLEFYAWHEAINRGLADEQHCQWGCTIIDGSDKKELDLALMSKSQLFMAECKTEQNPFNTNHLHKLKAKADLLGGNYVYKFFVTNQYEGGRNINDFCDLAKRYQIVVITGEKLPGFAQILAKELEKPTYPGI